MEPMFSIPVFLLKWTNSFDPIKMVAGNVFNSSSFDRFDGHCKFLMAVDDLNYNSKCKRANWPIPGTKKYLILETELLSLR